MIVRRCIPTILNRRSGSVNTSYINISTASEFSSGAFPLPSNAAGDLMVLFVGGDTPNTPSGWTLRHSVTGGATDGIRLYTKESTGAEASVTITIQFVTVGVVCYVFSAKDYDVSAGGNESGSGTTILAPDVTATTSSGILVSAWATNSENGVITPPVSMTGVTQVRGTGDSGFTQMRTAYEQLLTSGATGTRTATFSSAFRRGKVSLVVK